MTPINLRFCHCFAGSLILSITKTFLYGGASQHLLSCASSHPIRNPEDGLQAFFLSFYHVWSRNQTQVVRLGGKCLLSTEPSPQPASLFPNFELTQLCLFFLVLYLSLWLCLDFSFIAVLENLIAKCLIISLSRHHRRSPFLFTVSMSDLKRHFHPTICSSLVLFSAEEDPRLHH